MSGRRTTPEHWAKALEAKGIPSARVLAAKAGVSATAVLRMMHNDGDTSGETITAVAEVLSGGDRTPVLQLMGSERRDHGNFDMPDKSFLLTPKQRKAVEAVIAAMVDGDEEREHVRQKPTKKAHRSSGVQAQKRRSPERR